uniref:Virion structural protein n=1 Tax=Burkholderia phage vB_BgluM-SURPRISE13 TaxID=3159457 RepID=A0AAU7PF08_9VIRU
MDYLVDYALKNIWCSPRQDKQFRSRPKRLSQYGGEYVKMELDWLQIYLPDNTHYWHVYQVGQIHPDYFGLPPVQNQWISFLDACNQMGMVVEAYTEKGVMLPKFETYFMVTKAKNLIIATKKEDTLLNVDYNTEDIFFRTYTNAYWQSERSNGNTEMIVAQGMSPLMMNDILNMQTKFMQYRAKPGYAYAIINGYWSEEISPLTCKVGDLVEWIYDSSVTKTVEYDVNNLPSFDSTMDSERKYLLHYSDPMTRIEYQDDVDLFLIQRPAAPAKANGVYHHKNTAAALRMVTHKDYSMSVALINSFVDAKPGWTDPQQCKVLALIRESGYDRPLVYEKNRIHELYKLHESDFLPAMIGDNATVANWQAAILEAADYTKIMRLSNSTQNGQVNDQVITRDMVQSALGYNAVSKVLGDTPLKVVTVDGVKMVNLPQGMYENATCYEYDQDGLLLGWYLHDVGDQYVVQNQTCTLVEAIYGHTSQQLDEVYDTQVQTLDPTLNYRMYVCDKIGGVAQNNWKDVTGSGQYSVVNNQLTWIINMNNFSTLVRSDKNSLGYMITEKFPDGVISFDLIQVVTKNGQTGSQAMVVPAGELDIIMNARSLTEGLDYFVQFPKVVICNKKYLVDPANQEQQIAVRFSGFCKSDLTRQLPEDNGFLKYDLLSRNSIYNLRDDRVLRIIVDGRLRFRDDLLFSENDALVAVPDGNNGEPYSVRDMIVPMRSLTDGDTYSWRDDARAIDKAVSDYLSAKLPEPVPSGPDVIPDLYHVFTPFLCKIMYDCLAGTIDINQLKVQYDANLVKQICAPYEWLLAFDPSQTATAVDPNYVIVDPHFLENVIDIDIYYYQFLQWVITVYMKGKVVLNHFLRLKAIT